MPLILYVLDSLFFATPKSKRVLLGSKVGGEVHGEGQGKGNGGGGVLVIYFFGVYAPLVKRFSLPIRRVRGREARFVDSLFFATLKSKRVLMHARRYKVLTRCTLGLPGYLFFLSWTLCFMRRPRVSMS